MRAALVESSRASGTVRGIWVSDYPGLTARARDITGPDGPCFRETLDWYWVVKYGEFGVRG
jgi:hypothetical protein